MRYRLFVTKFRRAEGNWGISRAADNEGYRIWWMLHLGWITIGLEAER